ncbi:fumarylacetoacetate hydrolase family protein [Halobacterium yunchengense]|uniref:fumarylacetoacetate hydrolase family protein n=1 Tax=Halobacterium yunchengense TaxID=3108497 RepID=UPI0030087366
MQFFRVTRDGAPRLVVREDREAEAYDVTAARRGLRTYRDLLSATTIADAEPDEVVRWLRADADPVPRERLAADAKRPLDPDEVWAAGVTYRISEDARESESGTPDIYVDVYDSERPEVFFKATPSRTVGPGEAVGVRADSSWDVPEPELGLVLYEGEIVGYTVGNDVSSRDIEGANPLYLPQAKIYDRSCAVGPCVVSPAGIDPADVAVSLVVERDGGVVYEGTTSTAKMVRSYDELASYFRRHNAVPELAVLLTGTTLVPGDDFTLRPGDVTRIEIEGVGVLENPVVEV